MWLIRDFFFLMLFFVLVVAWGLAWLAFHITVGTIHILLMVAVSSADSALCDGAANSVSGPRGPRDV